MRCFLLLIIVACMSQSDLFIDCVQPGNSMLSAGVSFSNEHDDAEHKLFYEFLDSIGVPSIRGKTFCRVTISRPAGDSDKAIVLHAISMIETLGAQVLFTDNATVLRAGSGASASIKTSPVDFNSYVNELIEAKSPYEDSLSPGYCIEMGSRSCFGRWELDLFPAMRDMIVARWCSEVGLRGFEAKLWARAGRTMPVLVDLPKLEDKFRHYLPGFFLDRAVASMANPLTQRTDCISQLEWIAQEFPQNPYGEQAAQLGKGLALAAELEKTIAIRLGDQVDQRENPDLLVMQLIDQEWCGGDPDNGFIPLVRSGAFSPWTELMQADNIEDVTARFENSQAPTRLVWYDQNDFPKMKWEKLGDVVQILRDRHRKKHPTK